MPIRTPEGDYVFITPREPHIIEDMAIMAYLTGLELLKSRKDVEYAQSEMEGLKRMSEVIHRRIDKRESRMLSRDLEESAQLKSMREVQAKHIRDMKRILSAKLTTRKRKILSL